tara:strand:- start:72 stop:344 length:273 start_codon:yes stop_codon:yes gene_type:complete
MKKSSLLPHQRIKKSRKLSTKTIRKGVSQLICMVDDKSNTAYVHIDYTSDGRLCIQTKSAYGINGHSGHWELLLNRKDGKIIKEDTDVVS